jgi:rod shape-determining protein MreC
MKLPSGRTLQGLVVISIVVGLILLALSGYLSPLTNSLLNPVVQGQSWISERYFAIRSFFNAPEDLARLRQRNTELEAENSRLKIQIIELQQQVTEAQVLSTLVGYARKQSESQYIAASVIGFDTNPFLRYVIINRGSDDGLKPGMPVVTNQGLVGQVSAVTAMAARIQLITDSTSAVNVHLQQANEDALLIGQLNGDVVLDKIPQSANVLTGELVVTSGLGGNYPPNLVVGQVTSVRRRDFDLFQTAAVQPAVDFRQLEIVLVIINFQPVNITPLIPGP